MEVTETSNGIRIDIPLPPSLNSEMTGKPVTLSKHSQKSCKISSLLSSLPTEARMISSIATTSNVTGSELKSPATAYPLTVHFSQ